VLPFTILKRTLVESTKRETQTTALEITPAQLMLAFAGLFLLNLLLRVFYIRYDFVNGDEGVRALTAVRMLEGARLYAEVVTDKPPGASLFYAAVFDRLEFCDERCCLLGSCSFLQQTPGIVGRVTVCLLQHELLHPGYDGGKHRALDGAALHCGFLLLHSRK
jgi:hypothetical protein